MPPIEYDARSLVPDLTDSLRMAFGVAQQRKEEREETRKGEELAGLESQLPAAGGTDALLTPENVKILQRMARLDPNAAKFAIGLAQVKDQRELERASKESENASRVFQAFLDVKDPAERNRFLGSTIRDMEANGHDTAKLRELIGLKPDQQTLRARAGVILAGDMKMLSDRASEALLAGLKVQGQQLENIQKRQQIEIDARKENRDTAKAGTDAAAGEKKADMVRQEAQRAYELTGALIGDSDGLAAAAGSVSSKLPTFSEAGVRFEDNFSELQSLLTLGNLDRMTGVLSESDIKLLREAASGLTLRSEQRLKEKLPQIRERLRVALGVPAGDQARTAERVRQQTQASESGEADRQARLQAALAKHGRR
jgi:hypothetical protein